EGGEQGGDPELDPARAGDLARRDPPLGAELAHGVDQRDVDRNDDERRGDEADPKQSVDLVSARGVGRQSAAILITWCGAPWAGGAAVLRGAIRAKGLPRRETPTYTRRPDEEALPAITRAATGGAGRRDGPGGHRLRGAAAAQAVA